MLECLSSEELSNDREWWEIYQSSFPPSEREPAEVILESLNKGGFAARARRNDRTIGIATAQLLTDPPLIFLVYLAVEASQRSRGQGAQLLDYVAAMGQQRLQARGLSARALVWESDRPELAASDVERLLSSRRLAFYRRNGGEIIEPNYLQPPVDGIAPVPMLLMWRPIDAATPPNTASIVDAIYYEKYGAINGIAAEILSRLSNSLSAGNIHHRDTEFCG